MYYNFQQLVPRHVDLNLLYGARQLLVQGNQNEAPALHAAGKFHVKYSLERASIARQGGADTLDEWLDLRIPMHIQHMPGMPAALHGQYAAGEHQGFTAGPQSGRLSLIPRGLTQISPGLDRGR